MMLLAHMTQYHRQTICRMSSPVLFLIPSLCAWLCRAQMPNENGGAAGERKQCAEYWEYPCEDGLHCIARYDVCDGIEQCADGSDERNCQRHERPNGYARYEHEPDRAPPHSAPASPLASTTRHPPSMASTKRVAPTKEEKRLPMEVLLVGGSIFVLVAALVHAWTKLARRRRVAKRGGAVLGFRQGESLAEDEDDLLISQMYG